jgi:hypothetical protein
MKSLYEQLASSNLMTACNLLNKSIKDNGGFFDARQKKHLCPMTTSTRAAAAAFPFTTPTTTPATPARTPTMANTKKKTKRNTATSREIARLKATIYKVAWQAFKEEDINRLRTSLYKVAWQAFKEESK